MSFSGQMPNSGKLKGSFGKAVADLTNSSEVFKFTSLFFSVCACDLVLPYTPNGEHLQHLDQNTYSHFGHSLEC